MEEIIQKLLKTAGLLATVRVDGDYWMVMAACRNTVLQVAEELKNEINDKCDS